MLRVVGHLLAGNGGAQTTVGPMIAGAQVCGDDVRIVSDTAHKGPDYDVAVFWGYIETLQKVMKDYVEAGKHVVYIDLAYWERSTHYKVAVNARHPTKYFQNVKHDDVRRKKFGVEPKAYRLKDDGHVLVAGLSQKAAWAEHEGPWGEYEERAIEEIRKHTSRNIVYRPKTTGSAKAIPGTVMSNLNEPLDKVLNDAWAVVSRHSNVVVDGHVVGVPSFCWYGVGLPMSLQDMAMIERPYYPSDEERLQWLNDIAYCQWSVEEMRNGTVWRHLKNEGIIPS